MSTVSLPGLNLSKTSSKIESIDHTWLRMGNPIMVINTIYDFEVAIDKDKIFSYLFDRISKIEKYNAIPVDGKWVAKNSLDYDYHFTFTQAVEGYQKEISNIVSTPLDESHPYWRFHLIKFSESRFSLVMRTHHGYGDGSALVGLLNYLDQNWTGKQMEMNPSRARRRGFKDIFKVSYLKDLMSILFLLPDGPSVFKSSAQPKKDIAISHEIELDRLKRISKYFSCTINDVVTAIHTGVLQRLNVATESKKKLKKVRVTVPANLRDGEDMNEVANAFGHYFLELPIDEEMTANRLKISQKRMRQLKQSSHPLVIYDVLSLLGKAPQLIQKLTLKLSANGTTAVMSNVVGPRKKIVLADYSVSSLAFVVPHGEMAMGLSALSYEKGVRLAIAINAGQIQGLDYFSDMVESEISILEELLDSPLYKSRVKMSEIA